MEILLAVIKYAAITYVVYALGNVAFSNRKRASFIWEVWRAFRPWMLIPTILGLMAVFTVGVTLATYVPFMKYGWVHLLQPNGGSILSLVGNAGTGSPSIGGILASCIFWGGLICLLPFLAEVEELVFRHGVIENREIVSKSIKFGLIHLIMGIPLSFAIGLIFPGLMWGFLYKRKYGRELKKLRIGIHPVVFFNAGVSPEEVVALRATFYTTVIHTFYNTTIFLASLLIYLMVAFT